MTRLARLLAPLLTALALACTSTPPPTSGGLASPTPEPLAQATTSASHSPASAGPTVAPTSAPTASPSPTPQPTSSATPGVIPQLQLSSSLASQLRSTLNTQRTTRRIPGVSAAVMFPDGSMWSGASGYWQLNPERRATVYTPFVAGSITKTFITAALMQLAEEGTLALNDPLADWLPDYPRADQITLRMLLGHTSGVFNLYEHPDYTELVVRQGAGRSWTAQEVLDQLVGEPDFAPGTGYHYSNTGFILLGLVIEAATGKSIGGVLRERFFEPLGLTNSYYQNEVAPPANSARGYLAKGSRFRPITDQTSYRPTLSEATVIGAAGAVVAGARDICRWGDALYGGDVVSAESLAQMTDYEANPYSEDTYGLGTRTRLFGEQRMFGHTGALRGFNGAMWHLPELDLTVVVLTNRSRIDPNKVVDALLAVALPAVQ